ncbi:vegetative cell wall protein gp1-like [Zingiber officinale]|uniref:vegetative cell wall protein gp1-like n=1 Tax=Zingiber officinale TaxID=94328 RepID=UPI001C4B88FC|nr:vegetative cell wall protein gp1-like [Zingiber officinale]
MSPPVPPVTYPAPPQPVPATAYPTPVPVVPVTPPVPPSTIPPSPITYIDPAVPPAVLAPTYATAPGVSTPAYPAIPLGEPTPVVPPVLATVPTHLIDIIVARAWIPTLAELMKSRFTLFRGETDPSMDQSWIETMERTFFHMACSKREKAELAAFHLRDEADFWWDI